MEFFRCLICLYRICFEFECSIITQCFGLFCCAFSLSVTYRNCKETLEVLIPNSINCTCFRPPSIACEGFWLCSEILASGGDIVWENITIIFKYNFKYNEMKKICNKFFKLVPKLRSIFLIYSFIYWSIIEFESIYQHSQAMCAEWWKTQLLIRLPTFCEFLSFILIFSKYWSNFIIWINILQI